MRTFLMGTMAAMVVATVAGSVSADQVAQVGNRPTINLAPTVKIVGFARPFGNGAAPYTGGSVDLAVDVENTSSSAAENVTVKLMIGSQMLQTSLSVPPKGKRAAIFWDTAGIGACAPKTYKMQLSGPGTAPTMSEGKITPSCTFSSTIENTWNKMSPDAVEAQKAGNAYLTNASVVAAPACGKGTAVKVKIINKSSLSSPSLIVQEKEWDSTPVVTAQVAAAFPLAAGESKDLLLSPTGQNGDYEPPAKTALSIKDWTKSLGGHTNDGGIFVNTTRSCALTFKLD